MNGLAYVLAESGGSLSEALDLARRAQEKNPGDPHFSDTLGWIYLKQHSNQNGAIVFRVLTEKYPENPTFRYHLAMALLENGDRAAAKNELKTALSKSHSAEVRQEIETALDRAG